MQTAQVRAMYELDQMVRFQLVLDETLDARIEVENEAFATSELRGCDLGCSTNLRP